MICFVKRDQTAHPFIKLLCWAELSKGEQSEHSKSFLVCCSEKDMNCYDLQGYIAPLSAHCWRLQFSFVIYFDDTK